MGSRTLLVALILTATALFAAGVAVEASTGGTQVEAPGESVESTEATSHADEASEVGQGGEAHVEESGVQGEEGELLGLNPESMPLVVLAAVVSLGLALAVWLAAGSTAVLAATAIAMGVFAALDVRELIHQLGESAGLVAVIAGLVALLHTAAALIALGAARVRTPA